MQERPVKRATIYVRDSSTGQNGDESLKAQEECCQEYSTNRDSKSKPCTVILTEAEFLLIR